MWLCALATTCAKSEPSNRWKTKLSRHVDTKASKSSFSFLSVAIHGSFLSTPFIFRCSLSSTPSASWSCSDLWKTAGGFFGILRPLGFTQIGRRWKDTTKHHCLRGLGAGNCGMPWPPWKSWIMSFKINIPTEWHVRIQIFGDLSTNVTYLLRLWQRIKLPHSMLQMLRIGGLGTGKVWHLEIKVDLVCFAERQRTCHRPPQASLGHLAGRLLSLEANNQTRKRMALQHWEMSEFNDLKMECLWFMNVWFTLHSLSMSMSTPQYTRRRPSCKLWGDVTMFCELGGHFPFFHLFSLQPMWPKYYNIPPPIGTLQACFSRGSRPLG